MYSPVSGFILAIFFPCLSVIQRLLSGPQTISHGACSSSATTLPSNCVGTSTLSPVLATKLTDRPKDRRRTKNLLFKLAFDTIKRYKGANLILEIERKFVLDGVFVIDLLKNDGISMLQKEIVQFYTKITPLEEIRFRKSNFDFTATKKIGKGLMRKEFEEICDEKAYKNALKKSVGIPIEKTRFEFKINNLPSNIDVYHDILEGLVTLEIEFLTVNDAENFIIPDFIKRYIKLEITEDERYKNKYLSLFGMPDFTFDIKKTFEILKANKDIKLSFPSQIRSIDAMRVMFFQIYEFLKFYKEEYLKTSDEEALHQMRVNMRKTRSLLKLLNSIFDESIARHFSKNFKTLANSTNLKRDIDVFLEFLKNQKKATKLIDVLKAQKSDQDDLIKSILTDTKSDEIFRDWEIFLKEDSDFYKGEDYDEPIKKVVAKALRVQILKLKKDLLSLNSEQENSLFHETRIELKRFRYLIENFIDLFALKSLEKCKERAKEIQESFGDLQDRDIWLSILADIEGKDSDIDEISAKLKTKIYKRMFKLRDEILDKKVKFIRNLSKASRNLKIYYT